MECICAGHRLPFSRYVLPVCACLRSFEAEQATSHIRLLPMQHNVKKGGLAAHVAAAS